MNPYRFFLTDGIAQVCRRDLYRGGDQGSVRKSCIDKRIDLNAAKVAEVMSHSPQTIKQNVLAAEALNLMQNKKITALVVANSKTSPVGVLHMHDLLRAGLV